MQAMDVQTAFSKVQEYMLAHKHEQLTPRRISMRVGISRKFAKYILARASFVEKIDRRHCSVYNKYIWQFKST